MSDTRFRGAAITAAVVLGLFSIACPIASGTQDPSIAQWRSTVKVIGVIPVQVPPEVMDEIPDARAAIDRMNSGIVTRLRGAGYQVIEPASYDAIADLWRQTTEPLYDPFTRERNQKAYDAFVKAAFSEYRRRFRPDAVLQARVEEVSAEVRLGTASWDGVVQNASGKSAWALTQLRQGFAPAISLGVWLHGPTQQLYTGRGGLQLVSYVTPGARFINADSETLLSDPRREELALDLSLGSWLLPPERYAAAVKQGAIGFRVDGPLKAEDQRARPTKPRVVALSPLGLLPHPKAAEIGTRYEQLLTKALKQRGVEVIPASEFSAPWEQARAESGGFYDVTTGLSRTGVRERVFRRALEEVRAKHAIDAVVLYDIEERPAHFIRGTASWDGVTELVSGGSSRLAAHLSPTVHYVGIVPALTLELKIVSADGRTLYRGAGGIQLAKRFAPDGSFQDISAAELLIDESKDQRAMELALKGLR